MLKNLEIEDRLLGFSKIITRESISVPNRRFYYANLLLMSSYSFYQTPTLKNYIFTLCTQIFTQIYFSLSPSLYFRLQLLVAIQFFSKFLCSRASSSVAFASSLAPSLQRPPSRHSRLISVSSALLYVQRALNLRRPPSLPLSTGISGASHQLLCSLTLIQAFNKH